MQAQPAQLRQGGQFPSKALQLAIGQREWVAAAENDFGGVRVRAQALERWLPAGGRSIFGGIGKLTAEAVAAVNGTGARGDEQAAPVLLV